MLRKVICMGLACAITFSLTACKGQDPPQEEPSPDTSASEPVQSAEPTQAADPGSNDFVCLEVLDWLDGATITAGVAPHASNTLAGEPGAWTIQNRNGVFASFRFESAQDYANRDPSQNSTLPYESEYGVLINGNRNYRYFSYVDGDVPHVMMLLDKDGVAVHAWGVDGSSGASTKTLVNALGNIYFEVKTDE